MLAIIYFVSPNPEMLNGFAPWGVWVILSFLFCGLLFFVLWGMVPKRFLTCLSVSMIFFVLAFSSIFGFYGLNMSGWETGLLMFLLIPFLCGITLIFLPTIVINSSILFSRKRNFRSFILLGLGLIVLGAGSWAASAILERIPAQEKIK